MLTFLLNLQTSSNSRAEVSTSVLFFNIITDLFQLSLIDINDYNVDAFLIQSQMMCIKCAQVFHSDDAMYQCNAIFHDKIMYKKYNQCRCLKMKCLTVNKFIYCISCTLTF